MNKQRAIICDIDECLLDSSQPLMMLQRAQTTTSSTEAWDMFYNNLHLCKRNEWCYELLEKLTTDNNIVVLFITGRAERARKHTEAYLKFKNNLSYQLFMRPDNCFEPDHVVKLEIVNELLNVYDITLALDDRESNCCIYRSLGITTLKVDSRELH